MVVSCAVLGVLADLGAEEQTCLLRLFLLRYEMTRRKALLPLGGATAHMEACHWTAAMYFSEPDQIVSTPAPDIGNRVPVLFTS